MASHRKKQCFVNILLMNASKLLKHLLEVEFKTLADTLAVLEGLIYSGSPGCASEVS